MTGAEVIRVHARPGDALAPGAKLFDICVDLSSAFPQDCPPLSYYRIILRERGWLRSLTVQRGDTPAPRDVLALLTTEADEPIDGSPARAARITTAGIMWQPSWSVDAAQ